MAIWKKAVITNCRTCGIRRDPFNPDLLEEVIAELPRGKTVLVDDSEIFYSWDDKTYYKVNYGLKKEEGYINTGCVEVM